MANEDGEGRCRRGADEETRRRPAHPNGPHPEAAVTGSPNLHVALALVLGRQPSASDAELIADVEKLRARDTERRSAGSPPGGRPAFDAQDPLPFDAQKAS